MKRIVICIFIFFTCFDLYSQNLKMGKSNLFYPVGLPRDTVTFYNTGSAPLLIDSLYSISGYLGYMVKKIYRDSTVDDFVFNRLEPFNLSINSADSVRLAFGRPYCPICKSSYTFDDTLVIHSNSLTGFYSKLSVQGEGSTIVSGVNEGVYNYDLSQNFPNPFNPTTFIPFTLTSESLVTINIYNGLGQLIFVLFSGKLEAGFYLKQWDASNYPSGIYYYQLETPYFMATKKMTLIK